jgi:hypothetical protein
MAFINLTPHSISVYSVNQFVNLQLENPTTWVADRVVGNPMLSLPSRGIARITTTVKAATMHMDSYSDVPLYVTEYGVLYIEYKDEDINNSITPKKEDLLVVSLPVVMNAKLAGYEIVSKLVSPSQVVRDAFDKSKILGCTGFTF